MNITAFGKAVRLGRQKTKDTLMTMSESLGKSPAFLSAVETGKSKIPMDFVEDVISFFARKGYFPKEDLKQLAILDNQNAPLDGLSYQQQMMVAGFASSPLTAEELTQLSNVLSRIRQKKNGKTIEELDIDD
ncbi:XRE family transcriptional regulator [Moraxella osloensis]|nr:XRE family transcriptional regulator [Moraxella osloensis]MBW4018021.1 XRE family transcriptional regulator [Moraxella osloensis]